MGYILTYNWRILMSDGHIWKSPDFSTCELCGDKDWYADKFCYKNQEVSEEYENWPKEQTKLKSELNHAILNNYCGNKYE